MKYHINEEELLLLYNNGVKIKQLALVFEAPYKVIWRRLKKLGADTRRKTRKVNNKIFSKYNKSSCYWAGFISADGYIRKESPYLGIELSNKDIGHIIKFKNFVESDAKIKINKKIQKNGKIIKSCGILIYSHQIEKDLREKFNIVPKKAKIIEPPTKVPREFIRDFIRGNFDGDGSISWHKNNKKPRIQFSSGSFSFIEWIKFNIEKNIETGNPAISQNKKWKTYLLEYMGKQVVPIMRWLYGDTDEFFLERKLNRFIEYENKLDVIENSKIKNVEKRKNRNKDIIMLRNSGLTYSQISLKIGVSMATCYNVIKNHSTELNT